jgi:hypothetical protein
MHGLERYVRECGLEHSLRELLKLRPLQMNGFGYRIDMLTTGRVRYPHWCKTVMWVTSNFRVPVRSVRCIKDC